MRKRAKATIRSVLFLGLALLSAGCIDDLPGKPDPADRPKLPEEVLDFKILFGTHCAGCHGADGTHGPAPPLNDPLFRGIVPKNVLVDVVTNGRAGTMMPAFGKENGGPLTEAQIGVITLEIKGDTYSLVHPADASKEQVDVEPDSAGEQPVWGIPQTATDSVAYENGPEGDVKKGGELFARACARCHGPNGEGGTSKGHGGRIHDASFVALSSDQLLRRLIITGRPDLGMPNYTERAKDHAPLTSEEIDDLVAFLGGWRDEGENK